MAYTEADVADDIRGALDVDDISVSLMANALATTTTRQLRFVTRGGDAFLVAIVRIGWPPGLSPNVADDPSDDLAPATEAPPCDR
jgi:hypothetical protein